MKKGQRVISIQAIRDDPDAVKRAIARKGEGPEVIDRLLEADARRRELLADADAVKHERNAGSREVGEYVRAGKTAEAEARKASLGQLGDRISALDAQLAFVEAPSRPTCCSSRIRPATRSRTAPVPRTTRWFASWGEPAPAGERPPHWEIGERLGLFDLERGAKISGSGFVLYTGAGARLQRALIGLFLDMATERGYTEVWPPVLVNADSARGTGQLPDKESQMYVVEADGLYLAPTAEVPVTNIHRDEILAPTALPIRYAAFTPCFRREAGAAGKDTRGLLRVHQFDKVELVKFVTPETSDAELETLTADAEAVLQALELPYRTVERAPAMSASPRPAGTTSRVGHRASAAGSRSARARTTPTSRPGG